MITIKLVEYVDATTQQICVQAELKEQDEYSEFLEGNAFTNDEAIMELKSVVAKRIEALQNIDYSQVELIPLGEDEEDDY